MAWTDEAKLEFLMRLPWSARTEHSPEGDLILRIVELPGTSGSAPIGRVREAESDLWESLRETLRAYLQFGDLIPIPHGVQLPWEIPVYEPTSSGFTVDHVSLDVRPQTEGANTLVTTQL